MSEISRYRAVGEIGQAYWRPVSDHRDPGRYAVDLADTELLACAHNLPILVTVSGFRVAVSACLDPAMLLRPAIDPATGRYMREFSPLAFRAFPFRLADTGDELEIEERSLCESGEDARPLRTADGGLDPAAAKVRSLLAAQRNGRARLARAAGTLFSANLLVELSGPTGEPAADAPRYFTLDMAAYDALQPLQVMGIGHDDCLALDLATAIVFSRRLLRHQHQTILSAVSDVATGRLTPEGIDQLVRNVGTLDFHLDAGELIELQSFEPTAAAGSVLVDEPPVRS